MIILQGLRKFVTYLLLFLLAFSVTANADEVQSTENENGLIRVGLFYGSTAVKELSVKTGASFVLPGGFEPYYAINAYFNADTGGISVTDSEGELLTELAEGEALIVIARSGEFEIGDRTYRNSFELTGEKQGIRVVNILPLDEYLYGVLPNEIYPSWGEEALKATAIAARSFTLASVSGKHSADGFDVCTNTHCQMYRGKGTEYTSTNKAVDDTSGLVLTYKNKIISAMYNANNGGYTEGTENVWMTALPYYVAKPDPYTPEDTWQVSFTADEVRQLILQKGADIGEVRRVEVNSYAESGRALKLTVIGKEGEYSLSKDSIRSLFNLRSTMFTVETIGTASKSFIEAIIAMENSADAGLAVASLTDSNLTFTFKGRGYGHGVGISQWGCKNMSDMGKTYREILGFYYEGAEIKSLDEI